MESIYFLFLQNLQNIKVCNTSFLESQSAIQSDYETGLTKTNQTTDIFTEGISQLLELTPFEIIFTTLTICLMTYLFIEYYARLHLNEKYKFALNTSHKPDSDQNLKSNQTKDMMLDALPESIFPKLRQILEHINHITGYDHNTIIRDNLNEKPIQKFPVTELEFYAFINSVIEQCRTYANSRHVQLKINKNHELINCKINEASMTSTLLYLLNLMINITPPYGCIDISASHTIDHWQLHISNRTKSRSLISILFPSIFTVFPTQEYNNILIIRKIIHLHGGKINGDTNSKSNIIQIMVPRAYHFQNQPLPETKYKKVTSFSDESRMNEMRGIGTEIQRPHVLLIMADKSYSFHLNEVLSECYQVSILECAELTNNLLTDLNPSVIIIDEEVNGTPGNELCTQLKADRNMAKIPIILLVSTYENEGYSSHEISNADRIELRNGNIGIFKANIRTLINSHTAWKEQVKELTTTSFSSLNEESIRLGQCKPKDEESRIFMNKVNEILDKDIDIEQYTVNELCKKIGMCRTSLSARIKKYTGKSPKAYILSYKMRIAIKLLAEERYSIQEIATMLGFSTSKYFTKLFKKQYKICPSKYIQKG